MIYTILKNIFFVSSFLFYLTTYSLSETNTKTWSSKAWSAQCSEDKSTCIAVIKNVIKNKNNKNQTLATAYIQILSSKEKKMDLINEADQTYKLSEKNKSVPALFVKLPLSVDLRKKPALVIDNKKLSDLNFTHCNQKDGCITNVLVNDEVIDFFKKGKTMTVIIGIYGSNQNMKIEFPLKNFSRSYAQLIKK